MKREAPAIVSIRGLHILDPIRPGSFISQTEGYPAISHFWGKRQ
jgi:hypothetical protein